MPDKVTAYAVGSINTETLKMVGVSIFGESTPTTMGPYWTFVVAEARAESYELAVDKLVKLIKESPGLQWVVPILGGT
jgi:hypothetical protein